jgi:hypothetical protein
MGTGGTATVDEETVVVRGLGSAEVDVARRRERGTGVK